MRNLILLMLCSSSVAGADDIAKKCTDGDAEACTRLGFDTKNERDAIGFFDRGCKLGAGSSCVALALSHREGRGVAKDLAKAATLFERACKLEDSFCNFLGVIYSKAEGVKRDPARARVLFKRACDAKDGEGCFNLAISLERFDGGDRDEAGAIVAYQRSCDANHADGCFNLGYAYERGESALAVDKPRGRTLMAKACKLGKKDACPVVRKLCLDEPAPCAKLGPELKK